MLTLYKYEGKTPAEILELETRELEELRKKPISDLTFEEMGRIRRLLFRENLKSEMVEKVSEDNKYATQIKATCIQEGWSLKAAACSAPFVARDDGLCEHYTTFLTTRLPDYGLSDDEHRKDIGLSKEEYENYRNGNIDDRDRLLMIIGADPVLNGDVIYYMDHVF